MGAIGAPTSFVSTLLVGTAHTPPMDRFSEEAFRRFESTITAAVGILPSQHRIMCAELGLAPETVSARLRDAMRALRDHPEWLTTVNRAAFLRYYDRLEVAREGQDVLIRLRRGATPDAALSVRCENVLSFQRTPTEDDVAAVVQLVSGAILGLRLRNSGRTSENWQEIIGTARDVAILRDGEDILLV